MRHQFLGARMIATHLVEQASHWGRKALDFALPPRCVLCGSMDVISVNFCMSCWISLRLLDGKGCESCGVPMAVAPIYAGAKQCADCLSHPPIHDGLAAATAYDEKSGAIAMRLKYGKKIGLAKPMARQMARHLPNDAEQWLLVPVPLHRWRLWQRGFNQSVLIARALSQMSGAQLCPDALIRAKQTQSLGHMRGEERRRELAGAIAAHPTRGAKVAGRRVLLIDDVVTSGATSQSCVEVLKNCGAEQVKILCWARVLPEVRGADTDWA